MAKLSLKKMSVAQLAALRNEIQAALVAKVAAEKAALQDQIEGLSKLESGEEPRRGRPAKKSGPAAKSTRRRGKVAPKYRGPKGELWTGRGRAPLWLAALEADGKKRDSYLIKQVRQS